MKFVRLVMGAANVRKVFCSACVGTRKALTNEAALTSGDRDGHIWGAC